MTSLQSDKAKASKTRSITAEDWVEASRKMLIERGISGVKVEPLARRLGVTPGSFYWHYKNRDALYRALLKKFLATNVHPFFEALDAASDEPRAQYLALAYVWVLSPEFDAPLDVAVRDWGKTSKLAARLMRVIDRKRIELYAMVFERFGHAPMSALVRARTMYYHQFGYYAMRVEEDSDVRLMQVPHYAEIIAGDDWLMSAKSPQDVRTALTNYPRRETNTRRVSGQKV